MSENVMVTPLFHQRSHSMPVGHGFINSNGDNNNIKREFDYKRSSPLKNETSNNSITSSTTATTTTTSSTTSASELFPLPIPKSIASQFNNSSSTMIDPTKVEPNFFCKPNTLLPIYDYNNRKAENYPIMFNCKMDRGFFTCQSHWTCYRRNYFQVTASFVIQGHSEGTCYALQLNDKPMQPIQQFFLRLKACTSSSTTTDVIIENQNMIRPVALTQMTPKRDKGPQREPPMIPITPSDTVFGCEQVCVTFERLQFRVATANNGKRRASQQYFRLIFELIGQLHDNSQHVISECYSSPLVVRGRSPGHYSSDITTNNMPANERKRKTTLSPNTAIHLIKTEDEDEKQESKRIATNTTLPQPQYLFSPPTMVMDHSPTHHHHHPHQQQQQHHQQQHHHQAVETNNPTSNYNIMPIMTPSSYNNNNNNNNNTSAFSNFHNRSQSANDTQFYTRNRHQQQMKYPMLDQENDELFEPYQLNMARELRSWQQVVHQRNDSNATFDSFDNNNRTRPGTPIPFHNYNNNNDNSLGSNNQWSTTAAAAAATTTTTTNQQQQYHHV